MKKGRGGGGEEQHRGREDGWMDGVEQMYRWAIVKPECVI